MFHETVYHLVAIIGIVPGQVLVCWQDHQTPMTNRNSRRLRELRGQGL
jgi:hypothetical protein